MHQEGLDEAQGPPLRVAIIGAGPSGFYAAAQLLGVSEPEFAVDLSTACRRPTAWSAPASRPTTPRSRR